MNEVRQHNQDVINGPHIFGPVPSRRLGRSLGIDLVPYKTCTYDCIYCHLGRTTDKTLERREYVSADAVIQELKEKLVYKPDYITLSGSGEPTLFMRIGELIDRIRSLTRIPVAVLTNGSLLWQPDLRRELRQADLVIPSFDAGDRFLFQAVNRPHLDIGFEQMLEGLIVFGEEFTGEYWLEILLLSGHTGITAEVKKIAALVERIAPSRIQLNTATRPPVEEYAAPVSAALLHQFAALFNPPAEVISAFTGTHQQSEFQTSREDVLRLLRRRPCTAEDIALGLGMHANEVSKHLAELARLHLAECSWSDGRRFYCSRSKTA